MSLTLLDKKAIRYSFNRAADSYDTYAVLQREVESRLLEKLEFLRSEPSCIVDSGCGTGSASRQLANSYPQAQVLALDWAPAMLSKADSKEPLSCVCADMHAMPLAARSVDLIFSSLALQWSYDLPAVFNEFRRIMKPGGMLVFSCFGPDTLYELKDAWRAVDDLPHVNDYPDMHNIGDELVATGFQEPVMDAENLILDYPDVMSLMRELKGIGAHNVASQRLQGLTGKTHFNTMLNAYEQFARNGRYPATYEVIYGAAFAPAEGQPVRTPDGDVATFSLEALRKRTDGVNDA
jgi:malonyl-CoA O-methyltransferase